MSEDFLSRWSRRKREAARAEDRATEDALAQTTSDHAEPETPEVTEGNTVAPTEASAEALTALPSLEDVTAETDLAQFLREGVPTWLRNAALRRVWALDPAVRDYAGDARDYAYDWNTPGGVPGSGPLAPPFSGGGEAARLEARARPGLSRAERAEAEAGAAKPEPDNTQSGEDGDHICVKSEPTLTAPPSIARTREAAAPSSSADGKSATLSEAAQQPALSEREQPPSSSAQRLGRHGGATPS